MQSKITLKSVRRSFKTFMTLGLLLLIAGVLKAQPYINGPLSTGATSSGGNTAPAGFTWSELQGANTGYGSGANIGAGFTLADDFTVPAGQTWNTTKFTFYAYSTGATGSTSPFNDIRVQIFNTNPSTGTPTPVFGNLTTNRFASSTTASMYRIAPGAVGTTRQIWKIEATIVTSLPAGTYWVEWQNGTVTPGASNFSPAKTVLGSATQPGNNAMQHDLNAATWTPVTDAGPQDFPFQIDYTATGTPCSGTPAPGNTLTTLASVCPNTPFTLSLQNATTGIGVTYQWQSGPSATGPFTNITGATSATYSVSTLSTTTFYQAVVTCSGANGTSTPVQVAATPPSGCYCIPATSDCTDGDVILNVSLGTLNNTSTCSANGYANYTINPAITVPDVIIGASNNIKVTLDVPFLLPENAAVWIDYNRNGTFEASEFTLIGASATGGVVSKDIIVPSTVTPGTTRMRVRCRWSTAITGADACTTFAYGETEDYTVNLVPCVAASITTQPTSQTIACGSNATFTVAVAGSLPTVYWEYRTSATGVWNDVPAAAPYSGVNTSSLVITNASGALNGYQYRAVYKGACTGIDFSNAATLTVNALVATVTPTSASICTGAIQQLSITNPISAAVTTTFSSGAVNLSIPDVNTAVGITNAIPVTLPAGSVITGMKVRLNIAHPWIGDLVVALKAPNGNVLNLDYGLTSTGGSGATTGFVNTDIGSTGTATLVSGSNPWTGLFKPDAPTAPGTAPTAPTSLSATNANVLTFAGLYSVPNGNYTLGIYDLGSPDAGTLQNWSIDITYVAPSVASGVWTGPAGTIFTNPAATTAYVAGTPVSTVYVKPLTNGVNNYGVTVTTPTPCTTAELIIPVTLNQAISGTSTVANAATCIGGNAMFTSTAPTGGAGIRHQWKYSTNGGATFVNVPNAAPYSGTTTNVLTITGATAAMNGYQFKDSLYVTACSSTIFSSVGTLTVNAPPVLNIAAAPTTAVFPGITTSVVVAVNPAPTNATTYVWTYNGSVLAGATTNTVTGIGVDALGTYSVKVTDGNGCSSTSASITIKDSATTKLFIYPNPSNGQFHVRYHDKNTSPTFQGPRTLTIYDSKGARVYWKTYPITAPYADMFVDLSNHGKGIYTVDLTDFNGNRIETGRVLIQ